MRKKGLSLGLMANTDDGFRDDSGYDQIKGYLRSKRRYDWGDFNVGFSGSWLDQETAGFIQGENAYKDPVLRTQNLNPEAFRKASSARFHTQWLPDAEPGDWTMDYKAFLRNSDMEFRMHFVPDKSLEENGQTSIGTMITARRPMWNDATLTAGIDLELARFISEGNARRSGRHIELRTDPPDRKTLRL